MVLHAQPADEAAKNAESATFAVASASSGSARNPFSPIADYAFLSDCETTCLISPAGSVEWPCVPRPDSRSVFGAILDRSAGHFGLGPYCVSVPSARRYLPGMRDSTFALWGLYTLGLDRKADDLFSFIADVSGANNGESQPLQVMYGVGGERRLVEEELRPTPCKTRQLQAVTLSTIA